jgi:hypothetical protein
METIAIAKVATRKAQTNEQVLEPSILLLDVYVILVDLVNSEDSVDLPMSNSLRANDTIRTHGQHRIANETIVQHDVLDKTTVHCYSLTSTKTKRILSRKRANLQLVFVYWFFFELFVTRRNRTMNVYHWRFVRRHRLIDCHWVKRIALNDERTM